jgi:proteic killer suppression protein
MTLDVNNVTRYYCLVLTEQSFRDADTLKVWQRKSVRKFSAEVQRMAWRRLAYVNAAERIGDLAVPPGNQLEKLKGTRAGYYSIRVNDQYRICFRWGATGPHDVELVDYH